MDKLIEVLDKYKQDMTNKDYIDAMCSLQKIYSGNFAIEKLMEEKNYTQIKQLVNFKRSPKMYIKSIYNNDLEMLNALGPLKDFEPITQRCIATCAIFSKNIQIKEWALKDSNFVRDALFLDIACIRHDFETIKWLLEKDFKPGPYTLGNAFPMKNLECLNLLYEHGAPRNTEAYYNAIKYGNFEVLKWMKEKNYPMFTQVYGLVAIFWKDLKVLKWLHESNFKNCDFSLGLLFTSDVPEIVKWAMETF